MFNNKDFQKIQYTLKKDNIINFYENFNLNKMT